MALTIWQVQSGHSLGTFRENTPGLAINLPVANDYGVSYLIIAGQLPQGLTLIGNQIIGTPASVPRSSTYQFCIRAQSGSDIADRTLLMTIEGANSPEFVTPGGDLALKGSQFYVLDNTYVDFQLVAADSDTATGQSLTFFIEDGNGQLPPGLSLSLDGKITGLIEPAISIKPADGTGTFDNTVFDAVAYDFASTDIGSLPPSHLNRYYEFIVSVSDGDSIARRTFRIYVVTGNFLRADSTLCTSDSTNVTADATYLNPPTWRTLSNLGTLRASNYVTVPLETYETEGVKYFLEAVNADIVAVTSKLTTTSNTIGQTQLYARASIAPKIGYSLSFTKEFYPTPWSTLVTYNKGDVVSVSNQVYYCIVAHTSSIGASFLDELSQGLWASFPINDVYQITNVEVVSSDYYRLTLDTPLSVSLIDGIQFYIGTLSQLPPGTNYNSNTSILYGTVPYQPAYTKLYTFTVTAKVRDAYNFVSSSARLFTLSLIGEIEASISWVTDTDLGSISVQEQSLVRIAAVLLNSNDTVSYSISSGSLPQGLVLNRDGTISGKVASTSGVFYFTALASNSSGFISSEKTFMLTVVEKYSSTYSNLYIQPYLPVDQRNAWNKFILDNQTFNPAVLYRPNDLAFSVNLTMKALLYAGLETKSASTYALAMQTNFKKKRLKFGNLKTAVAYNPGTFNPVYEVVYLDLLDPLELDNVSLPSIVDNFSHNNTTEYYPSSIHIWRNQLSNVGRTEHEFLPLWMRSVQLAAQSEIGYIPALPICYCIPGTSAQVVKNIEYFCRTTGFNFNQIDFSVDRITVDRTVEGWYDKYLGLPDNPKNI